MGCVEKAEMKDGKRATRKQENETKRDAGAKDGCRKWRRRRRSWPWLMSLLPCFFPAAK